MSEQITQSKKITAGLILSWTFGVLFALIGITSIFSEPVPGLVMLVMAAVLLPPITKIVDQKWKFHLSKGVKIVVIVIGLMIFGSTVDTPNVSTPQQTETQKGQQVVNNENTTTDTSTTKQLNEEKIKTSPASVDVNQDLTPAKIEDKTVPTLSETISQKNAVAKAKSYLGYYAFSRDGLVVQLEYEQFSHADAVYGADNSGANWNEQAAKKAKSYMEYSAFSRGSLIEQLRYEKFTQEQAEYGANAVGL